MKAPTAVRGAPHLEGERVDLNWRNPPAVDFEGAPPLVGIRIARRERTFPLAPNDGDLIYDGPVVTRFADRVPRGSTTYYYTVFAVDGAAIAYADDGSCAAVYATGRYGLADRMYRQLPAVHQRYDLPLGPNELATLDPAIAQALDALPDGLHGKGQLYRFFQVGASPLDLMRSLAEGLRDLRDVDTTRPEFLLPLAEWLGWRLDRTLPVFAQRNEVKFAPRLYRTVGTIPNLRTIITRYTGWYTQVVELHQAIGRANAAPPLNIFAALEEGGRWRGVDDAGPGLGFGTGNDLATGSGSVPAILVGTVAGPFRLRPGMELSVTADDRVPVVVRFQVSDFASIGSATAVEVASVINRELSEATATALQNNRLELRSNTLGPGSQLRIEPAATSLVTLEGAPRGRPAATVDSTPTTEPRVRLFYETADPLGPATTQAALQALRSQPLPTGPVEIPPPVSESVQDELNVPTMPVGQIGAGPVRLPAQPLGQVRYKTFRGGTWGPSLALPTGATAAAGDPAVAELAPGRIWVGWLDNPNTNTARIRFSVGTTRPERPARLVGQRSQPFEIVPGTHLLIRGSRGLPETIEFSAADFADPRQATANEVATVLNARLRRVVATVLANQTLLLSTTTLGGGERLEIDLRHSSAASALGFDATNAVATGDWGDEIDWSPPREGPNVGTGRFADLQAMVDPSGLIWLFWASHDGSAWQVFSSRWNTVSWSTPEQLSVAPTGNREPFAVLEAFDRISLFWSCREAANPRQDNWTLRRRVFNMGVLPPPPIDTSGVRTTRTAIAVTGIVLPDTTGSWGTEIVVTSVPDNGRARDREPSAVLAPDGSLRVFFQSNRNGGPDLWTLTGGVLAPALEGPTDDRAPMPLRMPDGTPWLIYRSDRGVPLSRVAIRTPQPIDNRLTSPPGSVSALPSTALTASRAGDSGALRRFAGTTTVVPTDLTRNGRRRRFDDLLAFTPQGVTGQEVLRDDDLYTRGTVGLYVSGIVPESPVSQPMVERLRAVLERFLPINARAVVILAPRVDIELVYQPGVPGADIDEQFQDKHPDIENYTGLDDQAFAALPDWVVLLSTTPGRVSANPANLQSLRNRTFFPPPQ